MKNLPKKLVKKGFTLIELMVAMAIAIIIMGILVGITNVAMGSWQRSRAEVRASRQAKAMLDVMAKDIECLVIRSGNVNEWIYAKTESAMPEITTTGSAKFPSTNAAEFIFYSAATDRYKGGVGTAADLGGDVCTVSYKLVCQDPLEGMDNSDSTFVFYRQLVDPKPTFDTLLGKPDLKVAFAATAGSSEYETRLTASSTSTNAKYNFVCENIYQYSITFRVDAVVAGSTVVKPLRVTLGNSSPSKEFRVYGDRIVTDAVLSGGDLSATNLEIQAGKVTGAEISITVLSDFGINQLKTRTFADAAAKAKFLAQHSFEFSKSVDLPGM